MDWLALRYKGDLPIAMGSDVRGSASMELQEALAQISEIRQQMARTQVFRGYRAVPVAFSGLLAWAAAIYQHFWIPDPLGQLSQYLWLWIGTAVLSALAAGFGMIWRARHAPIGSWSREITQLAVEQFAPSVVVGGLMTIVLVRSGEESLWLLPGLWSLFFSLGIFASRRLLPSATLAVAIYYLLAGLLSLALARGPYVLSPWAMGITFGFGQFFAAAVLYGTLERHHGQSEARC
jgi:hypothetical protein